MTRIYPSRSEILPHNTGQLYRMNAFFHQLSAWDSAGISRPPEVCGSKRISANQSGQAGSTSIIFVRNCRFRCKPAGTIPISTNSRISEKKGTEDARITIPTSEPSIISQRWPRSPNPVTSVQAWISGKNLKSSAASLLRVVMHLVDFATSSSLANPPFSAVLTIPVPKGLVRRSLSPTLPPLLNRTLSGWITPATESGTSISSSQRLPPTSAHSLPHFLSLSCRIVAEWNVHFCNGKTNDSWRQRLPSHRH